MSSLGVWVGWMPQLIEGADPLQSTAWYNYSVLSFDHGETCGNDFKTGDCVFNIDILNKFMIIHYNVGVLSLHCGHSEFRVLQIDDSVNCEHKFVLGVPIHCSLVLCTHTIYSSHEPVFSFL